MLFGLIFAFIAVFALGQMLKGYDTMWSILGILIFSASYNQSIAAFGLVPTAIQMISALAITYAIGYFFCKNRFDGTWTIIGFLAFSSMLAPSVPVLV